MNKSNQDPTNPNLLWINLKACLENASDLFRRHTRSYTVDRIIYLCKWVQTQSHVLFSEIICRRECKLIVKLMYLYAVLKRNKGFVSN